MSPRSPQHERLHALGAAPNGGPRPLHESPAAQRLRARIPRPPLAGSPVPAAPYAVRRHAGSGLPHTGAGGRAGSNGDPPPSATMTPRGDSRGAGPGAGYTPARRRPRASGAGQAAVSGRRPGDEHTPLTALLEESDTERLPPPSGARRPSGRPVHVAPPSSPSGASTVGELSPPATDPDDDLLDGTGTTRL